MSFSNVNSNYLLILNISIHIEFLTIDIPFSDFTKLTWNQRTVTGLWSSSTHWFYNYKAFLALWNLYRRRVRKNGVGAWTSSFCPSGLRRRDPGHQEVTDRQRRLLVESIKTRPDQERPTERATNIVQCALKSRTLPLQRRVRLKNRTVEKS